MNFKSWPFKEAKKLKSRFKDTPSRPINFQTGYGPSGLPHIGTFAEVVRTTWVRHAFEYITGWPTKLIAFSDDMDGLRKIPNNIPNKELLNKNLGKPLCNIPDPYCESNSYSSFMNKKLQEFLDIYNFDYSFQSSYEAYKRGDFNSGLSIILQKVDEVKKIILPTMSEEKQKHWSPFFPICSKCGRIYSTRVIQHNVENNTIDYICDNQDGIFEGCGHKSNVTIFNGKVKVGWKVDWALRWFTYEIDYEMYGKDLIESAKLSGKIVRLMGKYPPTSTFYELFLDEDGRKISKSIGKGLTIDSWIKYAPLESLLYYLFPNPSQAKKLFWGVVPKSVDDYLSALRDYEKISSEKKPDSPLWHIYNRGTDIPRYNTSINFTLINNLISALGADDFNLILDYLKRYDLSSVQYVSTIDDLIKKAVNYYRDFLLPQKKYRIPNDREKKLLNRIHELLLGFEGEGENELQTIPFDVAREFEVLPSEIFQMFYKVILGQERGPRFGTFTQLVGKDRVLHMLTNAINS